ncbi:MAG: hypothetical protein M3O78_01850 [Chloroflexota bacterium]|nr:hypothetical protein [Chloroflexota bacterium]
MSTQQVTYTCGECGAERIAAGIGDLPGDRMPCANEGCGSVAVVIDLAITDKAGVRDLLSGRLKNPNLGSRRGRRVDITAGSDYFRRGQRWHRVDRTIDYVNLWYDETITDEETGEVIRECHEPLSEHQGRGSAKRPPERT